MRISRVANDGYGRNFLKLSQIKDNFQIGSVVRVKSMEVCEKGHFFSTEIDVDNSFNHLGRTEIAKMGPVSHFLR